MSLKVLPRAPLIALILSFVCPVHAATLWKATCTGMSVKQVLRAVPGSHEINSGDSLHDGARELAIGPMTTIADEHFEPKYYFTANGLDEVMLTLSDVRSDETAKSTFNYILSDLRVKYGREVSLKHLLFGKTATFQHEDTTIYVILISLVAPPVMNIVYQTRIIQDDKNL